MRKVRKTKSVEPEPGLLSSGRSALFLGISRTLFYSMHNSGRLGPLPVALGRRRLWRLKELRLWLDAECPVRQKWLNKKAPV